MAEEPQEEQELRHRWRNILHRAMRFGDDLSV